MSLEHKDIEDIGNDEPPEPVPKTMIELELSPRYRKFCKIVNLYVIQCINQFLFNIIT